MKFILLYIIFLSLFTVQQCFGNDNVYDFSMENIDDNDSKLSKDKLDNDIGLLKINDINTSYNRTVYKFTSSFIQEVLSPIIIVYKNNVPRTINDAIVNFILNTNEFGYALNHILQGNPIDFGVSLARFTINSTIGILGFIDVSDMIGIERQKTSMDETLESWGIGPGQFLMIPFLGAGTVRSFTGNIIDTITDPFTWFILPTVIHGSKARFIFVTSKSVVYGFITIADMYTLLIDVEKSSLDPYSTFRNYYLQNKYYQLLQRRDRRLQNRERILRQFIAEKKEDGYNQLSISGEPEKHFSSEKIQNPFDFSMEEEN